MIYSKTELYSSVCYETPYQKVKAVISIIKVTV